MLTTPKSVFMGGYAFLVPVNNEARAGGWDRTNRKVEKARLALEVGHIGPCRPLAAEWTVEIIGH